MKVKITLVLRVIFVSVDNEIVKHQIMSMQFFSFF